MNSLRSEDCRKGKLALGSLSKKIFAQKIGSPCGSVVSVVVTMTFMLGPPENDLRPCAEKRSSKRTKTRIGRAVQAKQHHAIMFLSSLGFAPKLRSLRCVLC